MTNEEIIEELNQIADDFENERLDTTEWCGYEYDPDRAAEAVRTGAEAEESRTPRTPMYKMVYGKRLLSEAYCPECGNTVFRNDNYCSKCGQAIDWTEIEE